MSGPEEDVGFLEGLHVRFIQNLSKKTDSFEHVVMEHLKVSACPLELSSI
jgi:hypothetical protein